MHEGGNEMQRCTKRAEEEKDGIRCGYDERRQGQMQTERRRGQRYHRGKQWLAGLMLMMLLLLSGIVSCASEMKVHFLDVGQGLSILVQTEGKTLLYDGGDRSAASHVVSYLEKQGVETIDYLISSHYDEDHVSGLIGCLNHFPVQRVIASNYVHESKLYESFLDAAAQQGLEIEYPSVGDTYSLGSAEFEVLAPQSNDSSDSNNQSIVIKLVNADDSFLFTGDAEADSEEEMCASGMDLNCEVLVLGHHGSASSSTWDFLAQTAPVYAVISAGEGNSYGHPNAETMEKMEAMEIGIFRTDLQGTIVATSNGSTISWDHEPSADYSSGDGEYTSYAEEEAKHSIAVQDELSVQETQPAAENGTSRMVWLSATGSKYHSRNDCGRMNPSKARQVTEDEAVAQGYEACRKCF